MKTTRNKKVLNFARKVGYVFSKRRYKEWKYILLKENNKFSFKKKQNGNEEK